MTALRGLRFLEPEAAFYLVVLPVIWGCWLAQRLYRERRRRAAGIGSRLALLTRLTGLKRDLAVLVLATAGCAALVAAAARPQVILRTPQYESFDLIVLLDHSASMLAADIRPSRLERACLEIENFIRDKPGTIDRVALITFANTAIVASHLTKDGDILLFFLDWISQDHNPFYGTDLATALESALKVAQAEMPQRRKVVVLVSDGDDHGERLDRAIGELRDATIPVYVIGVGSDTPVSLPAPRGSARPTLRDERGAELTTRLVEGTLRRIAATTNGEYFRSATGVEMSTMLARVAGREQRTGQFRDEYRDVDWALLGGAALALSGLLILL